MVADWVKPQARDAGCDKRVKIYCRTKETEQENFTAWICFLGTHGFILQTEKVQVYWYTTIIYSNLKLIHTYRDLENFGNVV